MGLAMKVRVILTLSLICAFFILSWQSHDQNEDQLLEMNIIQVVLTIQKSKP